MLLNFGTNIEKFQIKKLKTFQIKNNNFKFGNENKIIFICYDVATIIYAGKY